MNKETIKNLNISDLSIIKPVKVGPKRLSMVGFARALSSGTLDDKHNHKIWGLGEYSVGFRKPGKESDPEARTNHRDGSVAPNPDDMTPTIWKNDNILTDVPASFEQIFHVLEELLRNREDEALEILAAVFYRSAYLLDYDFNADINVAPKYNLSRDVLSLLDKPIKEITKLPAEVYLSYLQLIAWNEDVKYNALGYDISKKATGRQSNLLTYTHLISVLLGKSPLAIFCYSFARSGGVAPLSGKGVAKAFPWLRAEK